MIDKDILEAARAASRKMRHAGGRDPGDCGARGAAGAVAIERARLMNECDIVNTARDAEGTIADKVAHEQLGVSAPRHESPSDMAVTKADILRLADILSLMVDLHDEVDARLARLEQTAAIRRRRFVAGNKNVRPME